MHIELNDSRIDVLRRVLAKQIQATRVELAHTEAPSLQRGLAADLLEIERLADEITMQTDRMRQAETPAAAPVTPTPMTRRAET